MTDKQFLDEVIREVKTIKKRATKEEIARLDVDKFNPNNEFACVYGMLTGQCNSFRARELYNKSLDSIDRNKDVSDITESKFAYFTVLEQYLVSHSRKLHNIIPYLKGEEKKLIIKLKENKMKTEKDTTYYPTKLSKKKALEYMSNNKGHFFTAIFIDKDGERRTINCQYLKDQKQSVMGYVLVKEASKLRKGEDAIRSINLQTLKEIHIGGIKYKC